MNSVIISEEKLIKLSKLCLSNLRNMVNDEYLLRTFNAVKRLRTLFFLTCQMVFNDQQKLKLCNEESDEVWNKELEKKFWEASIITKKSKIGDDDESEVEKVFNIPVIEKYSEKEFSLEETDRIFYFVEEGLNRCNEIVEDLYYQIKDFKYLYYVYNGGYISLDCDYKI